MTELTSHEHCVQVPCPAARGSWATAGTTRTPTVASYSAHMEDAGLRVAIARDLYDSMLCWSTVPDDETPAWASDEGPE